MKEAFYEIMSKYLVEAGEIAFFVAICVRGITMLVKAASGRDTWLQ